MQCSDEPKDRSAEEERWKSIAPILLPTQRFILSPSSVKCVMLCDALQVCEQRTPLRESPPQPTHEEVSSPPPPSATLTPYKNSIVSVSSPSVMKPLGKLN